MSKHTDAEFFEALTKCLHKTGQMTHVVYFADNSWHIRVGDEVIAEGMGLHDLGWWIDERLESAPSAQDGRSCHRKYDNRKTRAGVPDET